MEGKGKRQEGIGQGRKGIKEGWEGKAGGGGEEGGGKVKGREGKSRPTVISKVGAYGHCNITQYD